VPSLKAVILTYVSEHAHGRRIAEVLPAPQVDLYGSTEAGYLFVGEAFKDNSQVVDAMRSSNWCPGARSCRTFFQIYVTTRDREAMPLLRYHTGDIVQRFRAASGCSARGESFLPLRGSLVSPTDIDAALPADFACWHYSLVQTGETRWTFITSLTTWRRMRTARLSWRSKLLGGGARVNAFRRNSLPRLRAGVCAPQTAGFCFAKA